VTTWLEVLLREDLPPGRGVAVRVETGAIALFNIGGTVHAIDASCARCGSIIATGALRGAEVTCPGCGWRYDVRTGRSTQVSRLRLDSYAVKVSGSAIAVANCRPWREHKH
jgi:nitrite reductase/ring-hydroxylating ferredoxin subunit